MACAAPGSRHQQLGECWVSWYAWASSKLLELHVWQGPILGNGPLCTAVHRSCYRYLIQT